MDGTILGQGSFRNPGPNPTTNTIRNGVPVLVNIPSGCDFMSVWNWVWFGESGLNTVTFNGVANAVVGIRYTWQLGMPAGQCMVEYSANGTTVMHNDILTEGGFTLYNPSNPQVSPPLGPPVAFSAISNNVQPTVTTGNTAGLSAGSIVRLSNSTQTDTQGIDFVVGSVTTNTSFTLLSGIGFNVLANVPGLVGGAGFYRIVNIDPLFYPRARTIVNISSSASFPNAIVSTSVPHGFTVGQAVRFRIPAICGLQGLNPSSANNYLTATIIDSIFNDAYSFMVDVNTFVMGTFSYPTVAQQPSSFAEVVPVGENTSVSLSSLSPQVPLQNGQQIFNTQTGLLADATVNTGFIGMILGIGGDGQALGTPIIGPAGTVANNNDVVLGDLMYWRAGKSSFGGQ
jgi:hypothetical protein